jgi:outer membrane autotransporter protein
MRAAMSHPYRSVFRHLDSVSPLRFPFGSSVRGQAPFREGFHVWFNPYGSLETTKDDDTTYDGYDITRAGFLFGADVDLYNAAVAGLVFGYGRPSVKSALGKMDVDDFTFGAYLRLPSFAGITANFMVGGGSQSYLYKNSSGKTDFNGKSVSMSFELNRSFAGPNFEWIPLLALDYQSVSADSFLSPVANLGAVSVSPDDLNSAMFRIGLIGKYWRLRTRLQYSCQIAGEDSVLSPTTFYGAAGDIPAAGVRSAKWSKNWFDVGVGGTVLYTQHWRIFADYDFGVGGDTVSHLGSLNTVLTW